MVWYHLSGLVFTWEVEKSDAITFKSLGKMELEGRQEVVELFAPNQ